MEWTEQEDADLKPPREHGMLWSQIKERFDNCAEGALQFRYHTKLKDHASASSLPTLCDDIDVRSCSGLCSYSGQRHSKTDLSSFLGSLKEYSQQA
jgi:hypothetical protein